MLIMIKRVSQIINSILANSGRTALLSITPQTNLRTDVKFDSYDLAELTVIIQEEFGVDIFADSPVVTVEEILKKLEAQE